MNPNRPTINLAGQIIGDLKVIEPFRSHPELTYRVRCTQCATEQMVLARKLVNRTASCQSSIHGKSTTESRLQNVVHIAGGSARTRYEHSIDPDLHPPVPEPSNRDEIDLLSDPEYVRVVEEQNRLARLTSQFQPVDERGNVIEETH